MLFGGAKGYIFNILDWWTINNSTKYPVISRMARDIFTILVFTVASESAFSIEGRVLDLYMSCLKSENAEVLIYAQEWNTSAATQ